MGYEVKIQKVERPTNRSFYVNLPTPVADAIGLEKGEVFEWLLEDKNTLILVRKKLQQPRKINALKNKP